MFGLFRTSQEKELNLKDFEKWSKKMWGAMYNSELYDSLELSMFQEFKSLETTEQRLFAAYTSFCPKLQKIVKSELDDLQEDSRKHVINNISNVFASKGHDGLLCLLKEDYPIKQDKQ